MATRERLPAGFAALLGLVIVCLSPVGAAAEIPCLCRYDGQSYGLGECVCMNRSNEIRRACCGKVLNNTSWRFSEDGCPVAMSRPPVPAVGGAAAGDPFYPAAEIASTPQLTLRPQ